MVDLITSLWCRFKRTVIMSDPTVLMAFWMSDHPAKPSSLCGEGFFVE